MLKVKHVDGLHGKVKFHKGHDVLAAQLHSFSGFFIFGFFQNIFGWGALPPQTPQFLAGGAKPPQTPPLKRSFVTFDRGGQTGPPRSNDFFFGAADDTRASDDRPPAVRRPSTGRPTTVHGTNDPTVPGS